MDNLSGKILVTTDWHIGLKQNSKSRLAIIVKVVKELIAYIKENGIKHFIFVGDLFHDRISINVNSLNVALKCIQAISKLCNVYLIVGNHDSHLKNSIDINSLNIFKDTPNVKIIDKTTEISINGNKTALIPWLGSTEFQKEIFDMVFGHFDISQEYLVKSYVESNKNNLTSKINVDKLVDNEKTPSNVGDLVGDFVEIVKIDGTIFSGHIHGRKEFKAKGRNFIFVGDPYQQNLGERHYSNGFYIINEDNSYEFHQINNVPKHLNLRMSEIVKNIDTFDFSIVSGNIIHKIYDVDVDLVTDAKISQKINDRQPYEELLPDYEVDILNDRFDINNQLNSSQNSLINKSKLEYIKKYIENIDKKVLDEQKLDANKLYSILEEYYKLTIEEK